MIQEDTYKTITDIAEGIYTEKRSKFIAIAIPVRTIEEISSILTRIRRNITMPAMCVTLICWGMKGRISGQMITEGLRVPQESLFWGK